MKISLVNPPQSILREPLSYIPLGLAYIGASLLRKGDEFDVEVENLADISDVKFKHGYADVYVITYPSAAREGVRKTIDHIRGKYPESKIVLGGPHPSVAPYNVFDDVGGDVVITGEVEEFIAEFLQGFSNEFTDNINRSIFHAGIIEDLNSLSFPARRLFNYDNVVSKSGIHGCEKGVLSTTMISSRGCNYKCSFCCRNHLMYSKWRSRSAENIGSEIEALKIDYGIEHVRFVDDCFTFNHDRVKNICKYTKKLGVSFMCITRADICGVDMLRTLKDGGCIMVDIGVESGSDRLLRMINKRESSEQMKKCILDAKKVGLGTKVFLQYGLPSETEEDIQKTIDFLRECKPDNYTLSRFIPLPGSAWENESYIGKKWFYDDEDEKRKWLMDEINSVLK